MTRKGKRALSELNLMDRFLFDEAMEQPEVYQAVVRILLEKELEFLTKIETEKELRVSPEIRAVRLDVVGMDREHCVYYTEMQKKDTGNLIRRSRYYQAQLDVSLLEPGVVDFNRLNDTCFILVSPFDIFGRGLYRYTFEGVCRECPDLRLEDGATRIFINTKGTNREDFSEEFLDFMDYLTDSTERVAERTKSDLVKLIHRRVEQIRISEKMGVKYMQLWEEKIYDRMEAREEGLAEGLERGRTEGCMVGEKRRLISMVIKKLNRHKEVETMAEELEEPLEVIAAIVEAAETYAPDYDVDSVYRDLYGEF